MNKKEISILIATNDMAYANSIRLSIERTSHSADIAIVSRYDEFFWHMKVLGADMVFFDYAGIANLSGLDALGYAEDNDLLARFVLIFEAIACETLFDQTVASHAAGYLIKKHSDKLDANIAAFVISAEHQYKSVFSYGDTCKAVLNFVHELTVESRAHRKSCRTMRQELIESQSQLKSYKQNQIIPAIVSMTGISSSRRNIANWRPQRGERLSPRLNQRTSGHRIFA